MSIKTIIHIFDVHTIKPILLYSSEIWGCFNPFTKKAHSSNCSIERVYSNLLCEKLHPKFCKSILGLHKSTTNFAVLSELGRFPLHFDILRSMLSYWHRLENFGQSFPLLYNAYLESNLLFQQNTSSWYGSINFFLLNIIGIKDLPSVKPYKLKITLKNCLLKHYIKEWHFQLGVKLIRSYCTFKQNFCFENYLRSIKNFEDRNFIRFRISAHRLQIERGRYQNIPKNERFCLRCNNNLFDDMRNIFYSYVVMFRRKS